MPEQDIWSDSHSRMMDLRRECWQKFGGIMGLPILRSRVVFLREHYHGGLVLDVGAGREKQLLKEMQIEPETYESLDVDPQGDFTYRRWEDIPDAKEFSLIVANQVLEHLTVAEAYGLLKSVRRHLKEDGLFALTVPNMVHPTRFWWDQTHRITWTYCDIYGACALAGLKVTGIFRYGKVHPKGLINRFLARRVGMLYGMDWCDSIMVVGQRGEGSPHVSNRT